MIYLIALEFFFLVSLPFVETITRRPKSISTSMRAATFRPSRWFSGTQLQNLTATGDTGKATHTTLKRPKRSVTCQKASISTPLGKNDVPDIGQKVNNFFLQSVWNHVKVWPIFPLDSSCWVQFHSDDWSVILRYETEPMQKNSGTTKIRHTLFMIELRKFSEEYSQQQILFINKILPCPQTLKFNMRIFSLTERPCDDWIVRS